MTSTKHFAHLLCLMKTVYFMVKSQDCCGFLIFVKLAFDVQRCGVKSEGMSCWIGFCIKLKKEKTKKHPKNVVESLDVGVINF